MKEGEELTDRQHKILKMIVEEYIKTIHPVGSKSICEILDCSSATVRNEMMELEEMGLLEKTHTSSGRIPSEKGYRYYVDYLIEPETMSTEDIGRLDLILRNTSLKLSDAITKSMEIISEMTSYTAVVLGNSASHNRLKKVEVVPVSETELVAIVVTDKGHVEYRTIMVNEMIHMEEIKKLVDLMNNLLVGIPINEIGRSLEFEIKPIIGKYIKQHEMIYSVFYNAFNDFTVKDKLYLKGLNHIMNQPEFDNVDNFKKLVNKIDNQELEPLIKEESDHINIYIGKESQLDDNVAVIKTKYVIDDEEGTIAIIGPKRMDYSRVVSLLQYIKENIER